MKWTSRREGSARHRHTAGAVVMVAVGLALCACGIPTSGSPTVIAKSAVPYHLLDPVTPTTVTATAPPAVAVPETIFLVAPSSQTVTPVLRDIVTRDIQIPPTLSEILGALLEGPTEAETRFGLQSFLTGTKTTVRATVTGGIATVDFTSNPVQVVGADQTLAVAQVVYTVTQQAGITGVLFQIAGQPIEVPTASGVQVPGPVTRNSYLPQAPA
jgi:spore germination protein GerM